MEAQTIPLGVLIIFLGIVLLMIGSFLLIIGSKPRVEGGAILWIGPFPIALTTSKEAFYFLLAFSLIFILIVALFYFVRR
ncbi:MAG: DUF131 domain-containing protein [Candidatus Aenigmarchaeota archaeon]|nr:DUF131 domain-containing protein [Candidatus Aenigmarchaeota archaeon]